MIVSHIVSSLRCSLCKFQTLNLVWFFFNLFSKYSILLLCICVFRHIYPTFWVGFPVCRYDSLPEDGSLLDKQYGDGNRFYDCCWIWNYRYVTKCKYYKFFNNRHTTSFCDIRYLFSLFLFQSKRCTFTNSSPLPGNNFNQTVQNCNTSAIIYLT